MNGIAEIISISASCFKNTANILILQFLGSINRPPQNYIVASFSVWQQEGSRQIWVAGVVGHYLPTGVNGGRGSVTMFRWVAHVEVTAMQMLEPKESQQNTASEQGHQCH